MSKVTHDLEEGFRELLALGDEIHARVPPVRGTRLEVAMQMTRGVPIDTRSFSQWRAASMSALQRSFGPDHVHTRSFEQCASAYLHHLEAGQGILAAALRDIEQGHLSSLRHLIVAEVFTDFLDMALYLLEAGYKDPAASLGGGVLEDGLRRIGVAHGLNVARSDNLKSLNDRLHQKGVYNALTYRQVHAWNALRDHAAHGHYNEYDADQVGEMLAGVRSFMTKYL